MPFPDETFEAALCHNTLECLSDKQAFLREVARVLRPGGHLLLSHTGEHVHRPVDRRHDGLDVLDSAQPRCVEHVRAGLLVGLQSRDRVAEVLASNDVVLRAAGQHQPSARRLRRRRHAFGGMLNWIQRFVVAPGRILDRAAGQARVDGSPHRFLDGVGIVAKPFSRSADTGSAVAATIAAEWASASSRATELSSRPSVAANPALVVATRDQRTARRKRRVALSSWR